MQSNIVTTRPLKALVRIELKKSLHIEFKILTLH